MSREVKVGILITADGSRADAGIARVGDGLKKLSGPMARVGSLANMAAGSLGGMGGAGAMAASQIAGLVGALAAGGPMMLALAAIPVAIGAATLAWKMFTQAETMAEEESVKLAEILGGQVEQAAEKSANAVGALRSQIDALREAMAPGTEMAKKQEALRNLELAQIRETNDGIRALNAVKIDGLRNEISAKSELITLTGLQKLKTIGTAQAENALAASIRLTADAEKHRQSEWTRATEEGNAQRLRVATGFGASLKAILDQEGEIASAAIKDHNAGQHAQLAAFSAARIAKIQADSDLELEIARKADADEMSLKQSTANVMSGLANSLVDSMLADHSKLTAAERAEAQKQIAIRLAVSTAGAVAAGAPVPYPGNIPAIISGIAAVIAGFAQIASYASGGFIKGGISGRDSVGARVMPGEYVMSKGEVSAFGTMLRRFDAGPQASAALAPMVSGSGGSPQRGGAPITVINRTEVKTWRPDSVAMARMTRDQAATVNRMLGRGMLPGWAG